MKEAQGRVLLLDFKTSDRKLFFWMQEPSADKDDEFLEKVNKYLSEGAPAEEGARGCEFFFRRFFFSLCF